jgi:5-methylcytosine-specific restriction enzyme subunit McrC
MINGDCNSIVAEPTEYGIPIRNLWYMLLYAWEEMPRSPYWKMADVEESPSLDALLASVLTRLLQQRLRIGLGCSYTAEEHLLGGIRGRIQFTKSLKQRAFDRGAAVCDFENYCMNVPKNKIIRTTMFHLATLGDFGSERKQADELRHTLRYLVRMLDGIDLVDITPEFIHREQLKRHDRDYRIMLAICDLILRRRIPTEHAGYLYSSQLERDRLTLHRVYERFVANFYRHNLHNWKVHPQKNFSWHEISPNQYLPSMRPDLMLEERSSGRIIILDTKFTARSLIMNQWGKEMFDSSHLYQLYAYLKTQEHLSEQHRQATGILLYPTIDKELSELVELPNHNLRIECFDLASPWREIENRMLGLAQG